MLQNARKEVLLGDDVAAIASKEMDREGRVHRWRDERGRLRCFSERGDRVARWRLLLVARRFISTSGSLLCSSARVVRSRRFGGHRCALSETHARERILNRRRDLLAVKAAELCTTVRDLPIKHLIDRS